MRKPEVQIFTPLADEGEVQVEDLDSGEKDPK